MATFETKVRHQELAFSPFSSSQMNDFGNIMLGVIRDRITRGIDVQDRPARALNPGYAKDKIRHGNEPIRNWTYSGRTMASLKVKIASEDSVSIGFLNGLTGRKVTVETIVRILNKMVPQWGVSPRDEEAKVAAVRAMLEQHKVIQVVKVA